MLVLKAIAFEEIIDYIQKIVKEEENIFNGIKSNYTCYRINNTIRPSGDFIGEPRNETSEEKKFYEHNEEHIEKKNIEKSGIEDLYMYLKQDTAIREINTLIEMFSEECITNLIKSGKVFVRRGKIIL